MDNNSDINLKKNTYRVEYLRKIAFKCLDVSNEEYFSANDIEKFKNALFYSEASQGAKRWLDSFIEKNRFNFSTLKIFYKELIDRKATIDKFFLSFIYSNTNNIKANLFYYDYYYSDNEPKLPLEYKNSKNFLSEEIKEKYKFNDAEISDRIIFEALFQYHYTIFKDHPFFNGSYGDFRINTSSLAMFAVFSNTLNPKKISSFIEYFNLRVLNDPYNACISDFTKKISSNSTDLNCFSDSLSSENIALFLYRYEKARLIKLIFSNEAFAPIRSKYCSFQNDDANVEIKLLKFKDLPEEKPSFNHLIVFPPKDDLNFNELINLWEFSLENYCFEYDPRLMKNLCCLFLSKYFLNNFFTFDKLGKISEKISKALFYRVHEKDVLYTFLFIFTSYMTDEKYKDFRYEIGTLSNLSPELIYTKIIENL